MPLDPTTHATAPPSVSSDDEPLILVDTEDRPTGSASKRVCHDGDGLLHRAFSIFLFRDDGRVLLQRRSALKRLWPLYWSNACCSHPRLGEETLDAAKRRLRQELGLAADLHYVYKFRYQARYDASGSEHELCWVFVGRVFAEPRIHPDEIAACREYTAEDLDDAVARSPKVFTPWFLMEWRALRGEYRERVHQLLELPASPPTPAYTSVPSPF